MDRIAGIWSGLSVQKRVVAGLALLATILAVAGLARMATQPSLSLLYSGLEESAAGEVVEALESRNVAYEIRGSSIFVEAANRDALRMTLAGEGLPSNPTQGYELLDQMTGFGTTSQMFDAAYWRAKEGELARTIMASPQFQSARVHIANPSSRPFQREASLSASVTVTPSGGGFSTAQARALRFLVASAVTGLMPENVSVIDANGAVVLSADDEGTATGGSDRAAELRRNVQRLLEARVGYGKAVVEVNVETVSETEQITERRIDPDSQVAISTETSEATSSSTNSGGEDVTVASNLPDGEAGEGGGNSQSQDSETSERVNYEVSEIQRQVTREPGSVARVTTAVLVNGITTPGPDGEPEWAPRPEAEMQALRELVSAAVGLDAERGDTLSIQSMQFEALPEGSDGGLAPGALAQLDQMRLIQLGVLAVVALLLGLFVVRPILAGKTAALPAPRQTESEGALTGEIDPDDTFSPPQISFAQPDEYMSSAEPTPAERLRGLIDDRQEESMQILRSWMEDDKEKA